MVSFPSTQHPRATKRGSMKAFCSGLWAGLAATLLLSSGEATADPTKTLSFTVHEGTWTSVDVSPDGRTLVLDLLGDLYLLAIEGGKARPLTNGTAWDKEPRFSRDGERIAFVSDR